MVFRKHQRRRWLLGLCILLISRVAHAESEPASADSIYAWQADQRFMMQGEYRPNEGNGARYKRFLKNVLDDRQQSPENLYLAASAYAIEMSGFGDSETVLRLCTLYPPKADDYHYLAECEWHREHNDEIRIQKIQDIAENAHKFFPSKLIASKIYDELAQYLTNAGRTHEAIMRYKRSLEVIPRNEEAALISAKEGLAVVYANPLLSEKLRRLSIQYYTDVIRWHEAHEDPADPGRVVSHVTYNRGVARIFLFQDYENAIADFTVGMGNEYLGQDARVFLTYSYAQLGRTQESLAIRHQVDLAKVIDQDRRAFLQCYLDLADSMLKRSKSFDSCLHLQDPQVDVLVNLTEVLQKMPLDPNDENLMWRRFYRFFSKHFLPDTQRSIEVVSSQAELDQERINNKLNQLKIQNLSLYQNFSLALIGLAIFLVALTILGFRLWYSSRRHASLMTRERLRLQSILDNIEEGIIAIRSDLTMRPEISPHLQAIVNDAFLQNQPLDAFLDITPLKADKKKMIVECLRSCFGEDRLAWDLNSANLPTEVRIADRHIALFWAPVYRDQQNVAVFLVLRDVSSIRQLEREREQALQAADVQLNQARQILVNPKSAAKFIEELPKALERIQTQLQAPQLNAATTFLLVHTLKGISRSLGFTDLQEASHSLEDGLQAGDRDALLFVFDQLKTIAQSYGKAMESLSGRLQLGGPASLFEITASLRSAVAAQLQSAAIELAEMRVIESETPAAPHMEMIHSILVHALSNAADHGFVRPRQRGVNVTAAIFEICYRSQGNRKQLTIRDNGAGINHTAIRKLADEAGWIPKPGQSWNDFLFESGVSTAESLTQTSGRGVGLNAIRENARLLGGTVTLMENDQGPGAVLRIEW